jgi:hypothetical protein
MGLSATERDQLVALLRRVTRQAKLPAVLIRVCVGAPELPLPKSVATMRAGICGPKEPES